MFKYVRNYLLLNTNISSVGVLLQKDGLTQIFYY